MFLFTDGVGLMNKLSQSPKKFSGAPSCFDGIKRSDREDEPFLCIAPQPVPRRSKVNMQKMKEKAAAASNAKREPAPLSLM
jgi:hypothetical protein